MKIENEVLQISLQDCATTNETVVHELRRLLDKEKALVTVLNSELTPDPSGLFPSCGSCMHHRRQVLAMREANAQEYKWVMHFAKQSRSLRLELEEALTKEKAKHSQLRCAYDELYVKKTDPLRRDAEVMRLRQEILEAKQRESSVNQTALMANKVADTVQRELLVTQQRVEALETEVHTKTDRIRVLEEIVDACRRSEELKDVGECRDYVCRRRVMDLCQKDRELRTQIDDLQRERAHYLGVISQQDPEQWKAVLGNTGPPVSKKQKAMVALHVADIANFGDLAMNLRSLFQIFPAWCNEDLEEGAMLQDFVADIEPSERTRNLRWMLACCNVTESIKDEELAESKLTRKCFAACIRALGGISKKVGQNTTVWVNVRRTRRPIYLLC